MSAHDDFEWGTPADLLDEIDRLRARIRTAEAQRDAIAKILSEAMVHGGSFCDAPGCSVAYCQVAHAMFAELDRLRAGGSHTDLDALEEAAKEWRAAYDNGVSVHTKEARDRWGAAITGLKAALDARVAAVPLTEPEGETP